MATDWTLEITKLVVTPVLAGVGAYVAFMLSNRGKKHDLLYKEKLEAFKSLSTEMLRLRKASYIAMMGTLHLERMDEEDTSAATREANQELEEFATRYLYSPEDVSLFLDERSRAAMIKVQNALLGYTHARKTTKMPATLSWMKAVGEREGILTEAEFQKFKRWGEELEGIRGAAEHMVNELYRDIGLPTLRPIFAAEMAQYTMLVRGMLLPTLQMAMDASAVTVNDAAPSPAPASRDGRNIRPPRHPAAPSSPMTSPGESLPEPALLASIQPGDNVVEAVLKILAASSRVTGPTAEAAWKVLVPNGVKEDRED